MQKDPLDRLMEKVDQQPDGCWQWIGGTYGKHRYGAFYLDGRRMGAHRASYILHNGEIPNGLFVCHSCDNRGCVNPNHLWLGTAADNSKDMADKGRSTRHERNPRAKLTNRQVKAILSDSRKQVEIAEIYGISQGQVSRIKLGKQWNVDN